MRVFVLPAFTHAMTSPVMSAACFAIAAMPTGITPFVIPAPALPTLISATCRPALLAFPLHTRRRPHRARLANVAKRASPMFFTFHGIHKIGLRPNLLGKKRGTAPNGLNIIKNT